jgi:pilus assembly protein CpaB
MRIVTMASLGASAALGVAALFVARTWLPSNNQSKAEAATAASVKEWKPVVIATKPLPYGTKLEARDLVLAQMPAQYVPEGSFTTIASVLAQDHGAPPVVINAIAAREPILPTKVSGPGARPSVAIQIAEGKRAYAIRVNDVAGVGGNILPGDRVDVVLMRNLNLDNQGPPNLVAEVVIQNIRLLGLDLNVDPASTQTKVSNTATIEVTMEETQKLAMAGTLGTLSLALRRTGAAEDVQQKALRTTDMHLVGGYTQAKTGGGAPPAAPAAGGPAAPPKPKRPTMIVVNGDKREPVEVPIEFSRGGGI